MSMASTAELLSVLMEIFSDYSAPIIFLGSAFGGNPAIFLMGSLAAQEIFPLWHLLLYAVLGALITEYGWFMMGRASSTLLKFKWIRKVPRLSRLFGTTRILVQRNLFNAFFLPHVLYGTKIASLIYLGRIKIRQKYFFLYNVPITIATVSFLAFLGWGAGQGARSLHISLLEQTQLFLTLLVVALILLYGIYKLVIRRFSPSYRTDS